MKFLRIIAISTSLLVLASCKTDNEQKPNSENQAKQTNANVKIVISAIVPESDNFELFYTEDSSINFNGDHYLSVAVKGKPEAQLINFPLSDDALPSALRLDIGNNKKQGKVVIESITINYYDKSLVIKGGKDFLKYFQSNNVTAENISDSSVTLSGKVENDVYDPMFYPTGDLINALSTILIK